MIYLRLSLFWIVSILLYNSAYCQPSKSGTEGDFTYYIVDPHQKMLRFYWHNSDKKPFKSIGALKTQLKEEGINLLFAMNGGMYKKDGSPQGLYIENKQELATRDTITNGYGNFYLQPNGIFYIDSNFAGNIVSTPNYTPSTSVLYATQSGPMLISNELVNPKFTPGSKNKHIRNGVGILPSGNIIFAISRRPICFYDFALFFKEKGCSNALYLDGYVSKAYIPSEGKVELGGRFGVIIGEVSH